jgi:hypothetical protein
MISGAGRSLIRPLRGSGSAGSPTIADLGAPVSRQTDDIAVGLPTHWGRLGLIHGEVVV